MKAYLKNIARNVRERRVALGWSQQELAKRASLTNRYISMVETAALGDFRFSRLDDLASALGCSPVDLLGTVARPSPIKPELPRRKEIEIPKEAAPGLEVAIKLLNQAVRQTKG